MEIEKNVYVTALRVLVKMGGLNPHQSELFVFPEPFLDFSFPENIEGKELIFVSHYNQELYMQHYDKGIEILEIEPACKNENEITVKINHYLCALIDLQLNEVSPIKKLTARANELMNELAISETQVDTLSDSKNLSTSHKTNLTCIKFKFNTDFKRYVVTNIETNES